MQKTAPSPLRIATMCAFAAGCFAVTLYMWLAFGGSAPMKPKGYQFEVEFSKAFQLPEQASVREAGITIGKVTALRLDEHSNRTVATIEIEPKYAPIHEDARAILRTKSVAGETYVSLNRGTSAAPAVHDGERLSARHVQEIQTIEDAFQIFDPRTRKRFRAWQASLGSAVDGRGEQINRAFGSLPSLTENATSALEVLDSEQSSLRGLVRDTGLVFEALSSDSDALRNTVTSFDTVLSATAAQDDALAETVRRMPSFLRQSRATLRDLADFSVAADPVVVQLRPALDQLPPALHETRLLSPDLRRLFTNLGGVYDAAARGLPAISATLRGSRDLFGSLGPFLEQLNPVLQWLEQNQGTTSDFFSNGITALSSSSPIPGTPEAGGHYLRQIDPGGAEAVSVYRDRLPTNRGNAYPHGLDLGSIWQRMGIQPSFDCRNAGGPRPAGPDAPPCHEQAPRFFQNHRQGRFPHVDPDDYRKP